MEFALLLKAEHSSDSPCCCSYLYLCAYMLSANVSTMSRFGSALSFFSLFSPAYTLFSHIQSITRYPFVMQMLPVRDSVHN